jgi:excisionase family DNA binding protein
MDTELLTPEEAAVYLRLNPQTAYRLLRGGQLPGVKIGRQWRIRKSALDAYLDGTVPEAARTDVPAAPRS